MKIKYYNDYRKEKGSALLVSLLILTLVVSVSVTLLTEKHLNTLSQLNLATNQSNSIGAESAVQYTLQQIRLDKNWAGTPDNDKNIWFPIGTKGNSILVKLLSQKIKGKKIIKVFMCENKSISKKESKIQITLEI